MMIPKSKFTMPGTEGTGQYVGVGTSGRGTMAVREYSPGLFRIRVEPKSEKAEVIGKKLTRSDGWKQPGDSGQNRFSKMTNQDGLSAVLRKASNALGIGQLKTTELDSATALRHVAKKAGAKVSVTESRVAVFAKATAVMK